MRRHGDFDSRRVCAGRRLQMYRRVLIGLIGLIAISVAARTATAQNAFWNFESAPVNPLAMTPDGTKLLACNTADARIEVFSLTGANPVHTGSIPVGIDPVS